MSDQTIDIFGAKSLQCKTKHLQNMSYTSNWNLSVPPRSLVGVRISFLLECGVKVLQFHSPDSEPQYGNIPALESKIFPPGRVEVDRAAQYTIDDPITQTTFLRPIKI